ncbi:hypothetical protein EI94DRAFT_1725498 [Lactarius quietus]|nr:hypothetical protein EI94DRAFT_1725498 [Lactarius quietus]
MRRLYSNGLARFHDLTPMCLYPRRRGPPAIRIFSPSIAGRHRTQCVATMKRPPGAHQPDRRHSKSPAPSSRRVRRHG